MVVTSSKSGQYGPLNFISSFSGGLRQKLLGALVTAICCHLPSLIPPQVFGAPVLWTPGERRAAWLSNRSPEGCGVGSKGAVKLLCWAGMWALETQLGCGCPPSFRPVPWVP